MPAFDFRPRSNTELLDASVEFVRGHFVTLASMVALLQIPTLALTLALPPSPSDPFARFRDQPALAATQAILALWLQAVLTIGFVYVVDDLIHGRAASLSVALQRAVRRSLSALGLLLIKYLVFILWAMLFFVPAIWAYARYFATAPAFAIEELGPMAAISRSKQLAKGNNGRAIALGLVPVIVVGVIAVIVQQGLLGGGVGVATTQVVSSMFAIVAYPFMVVPAIFLYYDLRTRREGLDLDLASLPNAAA